MKTDSTLSPVISRQTPEDKEPAARASSRDVARLAGLSRTTVSYVLNNRWDVPIPEATRARVLAAASELGYHTNPLAQALKTGRTGVVGLRLTGLNTPFVNLMQAALYQRIHAAGYDVLISDLDDDCRTPDALRRMARWPLDGVIAYAETDWIESMRSHYGDHCPAMVSLGWYPQTEIDHVWWNLLPGARAAMRHLLDSGKRRIAYLGSPLACRESDARFLAYVTLMKEVGLATRIVVTKGIEHEAARDAVRAVLREDSPPDAWFCNNDDFAIAARIALYEAGIAVPGQVALVGCDGLNEGAHCTPALSTVEVPMAALADHACELLERRMASPHLETECRSVASRFLARASSGTRS